HSHPPISTLFPYTTLFRSVMRDVDVNYRVKLIVRKDADINGVKDLAGKALILGSCDSADATVLPVYFLRKEGVNFDDVKVLSLRSEEHTSNSSHVSISYAV